MSTAVARLEYATFDSHADGITLSYRGRMAVTEVCGCGFTVIVVCAPGTAQHDAKDRAERALSDHFDREETDACRPWMR